MPYEYTPHPHFCEKNDKGVCYICFRKHRPLTLTTDYTFPKIVTLCGSTRFQEWFVKVNELETLDGNIVLAPGVFGMSGVDATDKRKQQLDKLHLRKIDISDEVFIVNVNGYVGSSTLAEIEYAISKNKTIRWLEPDKALNI